MECRPARHVTNRVGQEMQVRLFEELLVRLEEVEAGVTAGLTKGGQEKGPGRK